MKVSTERFNLSTKGHTHIVDITPDVKKILSKSGLKNGLLNVFMPGSTASITMIEYESGLVEEDFPKALEKIAPVGVRYAHDSAWGEGNGYAHVRASVVGSSLTVPFTDGNMLLGTWQQIVLVDYDNRARRREVIIQIIGE